MWFKINNNKMKTNSHKYVAMNDKSKENYAVKEKNALQQLFDNIRMDIFKGYRLMTLNIGIIFV